MFEPFIRLWYRFSQLTDTLSSILSADQGLTTLYNLSSEYLWAYLVFSTREVYPQYVRGRSLVPLRIRSDHEAHHQYMRRIISTREEDHKYQWVNIISTHEDIQYLWGTLFEWKMNKVSLTSTAYPQGYCRYASRVLMIFLVGTEDSIYRVLTVNCGLGGSGEILTPDLRVTFGVLVHCSVNCATELMEAICGLIPLYAYRRYLWSLLHSEKFVKIGCLLWKKLENSPFSLEKTFTELSYAFEVGVDNPISVLNIMVVILPLSTFSWFSCVVLKADCSSDFRNNEKEAEVPCNWCQIHASRER